MTKWILAALDFKYSGRLLNLPDPLVEGEAATKAYVDGAIAAALAGGSPVLPTVAIADTVAAEGQPLLFTVARTGSLAAASSVDWAATPGTATVGADYTASSGTLTIASGAASAAITIATIDDALIEVGETITVTLSNPVGCTIATAVATGTITSDDVAIAPIAPAGAPFTDSGTVAAAVNVTHGTWTGTAPITLAATGLPVGVTFADNGNGSYTLSGTWPAAGNFPYTITASNAGGSTVTAGNELEAVLPPSVDLSTTFFDDFNDAGPVATSLRNRAGWAAFNSTNTFDGNADVLKVQNGRVIGVGGDWGVGSPRNIIGRDMGTPYVAIECVMRKEAQIQATYGTDYYIAIGAVDEKNYLSLAKAWNNTYVRKRVGGGTEEQLTYQPSLIQADGDIYEIVFAPGATDIVININNKRWRSLPIGPYTPGNIHGFLTKDGMAGFDSVSIRTLASGITIDDYPHIFVASNYNNDGFLPSDYTGAPLARTGRWTGNKPVGLQSRVLQWQASGPSTELIPWADVPDAVFKNDGTWTGTIALPVGLDRVTQVRARSDTSVRAYDSKPVSVGAAVLVYGQSNAAAILGPQATDMSSVAAYQTPSVFWFDHALQGGNAITAVWTRQPLGIPGVPLAKKLADYFGFPVGMAGGGKASMAIANLVPTSPFLGVEDQGQTPFVNVNVFQMLRNCATRAGIMGRVAIIHYNQGEGDGENPGGISDRAAYKANLLAIVNQIRAEFCGGRNALFSVTMTGVSRTVWPGLPERTRLDANYTMVRAVQREVASEVVNGVLDATNIGLSMGDEFHFTVPGIGTRCLRVAMSMVAKMSGAGVPGSGPKIGTPTRAGAVITVPIVLNGTSALSARNGDFTGTLAVADANTLTGWQVSSDDFATTLAQTSAVLSGNAVVITLAAVPSGPVKIRSYYGKQPDLTSWVCGTAPDGMILPMEPVVAPVTVA